ncbi:hypothetical protein DV515_00011393 [Chloebia gouldiae]|uniref:IGFBP N-terminal domain-containing protein n=1 Tax=Chloebia gouldiae TaxID=44316 RepID=A0A3L8S7P8_CHLGU|nr:hypothetical protein DV515_00011393 [Chloebia gouldiae]
MMSQCPPCHTHPHLLTLSVPTPPAWLSCVLLCILGHSSCLGSASQPAQRHQGPCHLCQTCLRTEEGVN